MIHLLRSFRNPKNTAVQSFFLCSCDLADKKRKKKKKHWAHCLSRMCIAVAVVVALLFKLFPNIIVLVVLSIVIR